MKIMLYWWGCPGWTAPFFDADGAGGSGETAADEGAGAPGTEDPGTTSPEGDSKSGGVKDGSLLGAAGKEGADNDPGEDHGKEESKEGEEGKGGKDGDGDDGPVTKEALVIPEGQEWDDEMGAPLLEVINDQELTAKERAQKILDMIPAYQEKLLASVVAANEASNKQLAETLKAEEAAWAKASMADSEYGGDMWKANQGIIARGRDHLSTPEAVAELEKDGLGNHPEILRMFYRAGKLLGEDPTKGSGSGAAAPKGRANTMFGKSLEGLNIKGADDE